MKLILASNSPRRKELLTEYGFTFEVKSSSFIEKTDKVNPKDVVLDFALGKAKSVFDSLAEKDIVVLGADTVVALDGKILGKPKNGEDALNMLKSLSNRTHKVFTGYAIVSKDKTVCKCVETLVKFNKLNDDAIIKYIESGKPFDKAGAYGIQDGYNLVKEIKGSYNNVVGLPIEVFANDLKEMLK